MTGMRSRLQNMIPLPENYATLKSSQILGSLLLIFGITTFATASDDGNVKTLNSNFPAELEAAAGAGVNTILVITNDNTKNLGQAVELAEATAALGKNTMVAVVDKSVEENKTIVERYNMNRFPIPFVLILAPAGNVTGGAMPAQITAEKLANYLPSPCYNQALEARNGRKSTLILISSSTVENTAHLETTIASASKSIIPEPEIIRVDADDEHEKSFLSRIGYRGEEVPMMIVINKSGQVTGKFTELPDVELLKTTANKAIKSGCGGCKSSKSCSPKDKAQCGDK